ncbi:MULTISPECIES: hypothetical protein [Paenibacillus]|uniref:hypothetical protein n=1 Tax=Paenibacillus TaxID=44249 RepID=UPI00096D25F6|nr:hypothetical protein [Paenibacillus odorifer]OMD87801.1 hypothetical protein BSK53_02085 [Paenibacillus odorifer]
MEFLQKVRVKKFARTVKTFGQNPWIPNSKDLYRKVDTYPNDRRDIVYTIIGTTQLQEGYSNYLGSDEGYGWAQRNSVKVYIVAHGLGRRYKVIPEDLEPVGEEAQ